LPALAQARRNSCRRRAGATTGNNQSGYYGPGYNVTGDDANVHRFGEMTLYMEFFDSTTSAILGRVVDAEASRDLGGVQISNRVTNIAEADRILRKWADILRQKLDEVHGKSAS
jgi:hypothetical protein